MDKPWYQSKTIWLVILGAAYKVAQQIFETKGINLPPLDDLFLGGAIITHRVTQKTTN